jgi:MFS family permease
MAGLIGASFASKAWHLFLSQGFCLGWGVCFLSVAALPIVPQWFTTRRSLAYAIAVSGTNFGGILYSLAVNAIIQRLSVGWAFRIIGIVSSIVNFTCALLLKDRNKQLSASQLAFDYNLLKRLEYLLILAWGTFTLLGFYAVAFSLPDYARSIGLTAKQGSMIGALFNLGQAFGRPPVGYFSDTLGRINIAGFMTLISGIFILTLWVCSNSYQVLDVQISLIT